MKTSTLKKSLLDYAIKGSLSSRFRRENPNLNALSEIQAYNENIAKQRKTLQKEIQKLEKELDSIKQQKQESKEQKEQKKEVKENLKKQIKELEKQRQNLKTIQILEPPHYESSSRHSEGVQRTTEESKIQESKEILKDISGLSPQYDALSPHYDNSTFTPPFSIPPTWVWVRLGDICEDLLAGGDKPSNTTKEKTKQNQIPIYANGYQNDGLYGFTDSATINKAAVTISARGTMGFVCPRFEPFVPIVRLLVLIPNNLMIVKFLSYILSITVPNGNGTGVQQLTIPMIESIPIPLPPLKEQEFLAKKLDELVSLATDFDNTKEELKRIEKRIEKSLLKLAIEGGLSTAFRQTHSHLNTLDEIQAYNENIAKQRKTLQKELKSLESTFKQEKDKEAKKQINQELKELKTKIAKLQSITPLFPNDTNSSPLKQNFTQGLNNILTLDDKNTNSKKVENYNFQTFSPPFSIPPTWVWVRLGDICEIFTGDSINAQRKEKEFTNIKNGLNYIGTKDINSDTNIHYENGIKIPPQMQVEFKIARKNSSLLCIEGGSAGKKIGFLEQDVCFGNKLCCFDTFFANKKFIFYFLQNPHFIKKFNENIIGIIGGVSKENVKNFYIALPPLEEQAHIVALLDKLFMLSKGLRVS
ncbi:restriction endonuclease subunit S [Helicobacter pullorum]|uniref:restriction endonuclease subunit S n=1 Tax=Helicobacter pullorum TaxID=35818 RepID=UPI001D820FCC|nr:restriction endonuclease subunit S [Helicobacter pullorum]HJF83900.1 restriction endonuclease subunit S [Helicobacter pullorum]